MNSQFMDGKRHIHDTFNTNSCINFVQNPKKTKVSVWNDNNVFWNVWIYRYV